MIKPYPPPKDGRLRIMGIDPGLADVGYGLVDWDNRTRKCAAVDYGIIQTPASESLPHRLDLIYRKLGALIRQGAPSVVVVEQLFFARNVKTAMVVAHGRAACLLAAARRDLVGDALFGEAKVEPGFLKGRVDDRVGDYDTFDFHSLQTRALANQVGFDQSPSHRFDGGRAALNPYRCH